MTRQEIEQAIKNGDTILYIINGEIIEEKLDDTYKVKFEVILFDKNEDCVEDIRHIFKTKAQAQHYLDHANIERHEILPFVTWEEFKNGKKIEFISRNGKIVKCYKAFNITYNKYINFVIEYDNKLIFTDILTEENFYKAYDECVKLFKGEEL